MDRADKLIYRAALEMHAQLGSAQDGFPSVCLPHASWQQCQQLLRSSSRAHRRGWLLAAVRCRQDLHRAVQRLKADIEQLELTLQPDRGLTPPPSPHDLTDDLIALHEEFEHVSLDGKEKIVSVTTESIVLEGVYLGPFEVRLDWSDLKNHPCNYRVVAVDPQPSTVNENVTHPHVQNGCVCEGDGTIPIRLALEQGRILDFFLLIANLLRTYNSGSPYVALDEWYGTPCRDCGMSIDPDEWSSCQRCDTRLCSECYVSCLGCQDEYCLECLQRCACCEEYFCNHCLQACPDCREELCSDCLINGERCENCHAKTTQDDQQKIDDTGTVTQPAQAAIQPHRVGQTAVPT